MWVGSSRTVFLAHDKSPTKLAWIEKGIVLAHVNQKCRVALDSSMDWSTGLHMGLGFSLFLSPLPSDCLSSQKTYQERPHSTCRSLRSSSNWPYHGHLLSLNQSVAADGMCWLARPGSGALCWLRSGRSVGLLHPNHIVWGEGGLLAEKGRMDIGQALTTATHYC